MGTFHSGLGDLHGITVVVDTSGPEIWIGRCHEVTDRGVFLHDADVHQDGEKGLSKEAWVKKAAEYGIWKKHESVVVPKESVISLRRLGEIA